MTACAGTDPELFFDRRSSTTAVRVCLTCDVRVKCAEDTLEAERGLEGERYGVFGGLLPEERAKLARRRARGRG